MNISKISLLLAMLAVGLAGCGGSTPMPATETSLPPATQTPVPSSTSTATITNTATPEPTSTPIPTNIPPPTSTGTPTPTVSDTPTPEPTYVKLRGKVTLDQIVCHYGPGAPYLYKYGLYKGNTMEILRRIEGGNYVEVQAIGGNNPCWVKADYMDIKGDLANVQPVQADDVPLPPSPYYGPATGVSARRDGNKVTVFWNPVYLKAGDGSEQIPYIVEAFVCQNGQFVFIPVGSWTTAAEVIDEPGCAAPSRGWMTAAEKHGYTTRVKIPWPGFTTPTLATNPPPP